MLDRLEWNVMGNEVARKVLLQANGVEDGPWATPLETRGRSARLSFYRKLRLIWIRTALEGRSHDVFCLWDYKGKALALDGTSTPIHDANDFERVALTAETVADYVRLFCFAVRGDEGAFTLLEPRAETSGNSRPFPLPGAKPSARLAPQLQPLMDKGQDADGRFLVGAVLGYSRAVSSVVFAVAANGMIEMVSDEPVVGYLATTRLPEIPDHSGAGVVARFCGKHKAVHRAPAAPQTAGAPVQAPPPGTRRAPAEAPATPAARPRLPPLQVMVTLLLERALATRAHNRLIDQFNSTMAGRSAVEQFAELVVTSSPVTVIESDIPFVEEIVAAIVQEVVGKERMPTVSDNGSVPAGPGIVVLRGPDLDGSERLSHSIAMSESAVLIGCERFTDLPENLRRLEDVTLRLPRLDADLFAMAFARIFGAPLPARWRKEGTDWVRHVLHSDFEQPVRLKLPPAAALAYMRGEVLDRLRLVDTDDRPGLDELHGLGEARAFAKDLIADIAAAVKGRLPWSQVDRGALLVGAPGTGKTTLARAIARDCGVKFVQASATTWSTANNLGPTIQAVRSSFAEARRYAPAILFIDEIDSLGNRERLGGDPNDQWWTQIINTVLEQMQGIDEEAPVFVIAATNFEARVDPALKRAGRLDRVINIPYPTSDALARIYEQYLGPHKLARNVDARVIGRMSFGLTGADVESMVRGAARRARKGNRPISQADLIAELTRKPRDPASAPRLSAAEIERIAVHEAGHALARCLGPGKGRDIAFVSIVPRSDGTLGFVASAPRQQVLMTRREYLDFIAVLMAGRAAEELAFGPDGITGGARSDLAVATGIALCMVQEYGLGPEDSLVALNRTTDDHLKQADAILRDAYVSVTATLKAHQGTLRRLARALQAREELAGADVLKVVMGRPRGSRKRQSA